MAVLHVMSVFIDLCGFSDFMRFYDILLLVILVIFT